MLIERDAAHDLALYRIDGYRLPRPLKVEFEEEVRENHSLTIYEYGTTRIAGQRIHLSPVPG